MLRATSWLRHCGTCPASHLLSWPPSLRRAGLAELPLCTQKDGRPRHTGPVRTTRSSVASLTLTLTLILRRATSHEQAELTSEEKKRLQKYERYLVVAEPNPLLDPMRGRDPYRAQFNAQPTKAAF